MTRSSASSPVHQTSVRARLLQAFVGMLANDADLLTRNYVNKNPQAKQVSTLRITAFSAAADYVFSFNGVTYTVTEDGTGANATDVATQVKAAMEDAGAIYGVVTVEQSTDTLTLTARIPGFTFTLTDSDAKITCASVTSAADADAVEFGRAVVRTGLSTGNVRSVDDTMEQAAKADSAALVAQVDTWTVADPGAGQYIGASVQVKGLPEIVVVQALWDTSLDTTLDNLATILNAALTDRGLNAYVTVAGPAGAPGAGQIAFTAAFDGVEFVSMVTCDDAAGYPAITVSSNKGLTTSFDRAFGGVALRVSDAENVSAAGSASEAEYGANSQMLVMERGEVWVLNAETLALGDRVFVDLAAGEAKFYNSAGSGRMPLDLSRAEWIKSGRSLDGETLGLLRLKR